MTRLGTLRQFGMIVLALLLLICGVCRAGELRLSPAEQDWLDAHPVIRMSIETGYGPYTFLDAEGQPQGIASIWNVPRPSPILETGQWT